MLIKKIKWKCNKGHIWDTIPSYVLNGSWCQKCNNGFLSIEEMQKMAKEKGGKCISTEYNGLLSELTWECGKKHIWDTKPTNIRNGFWCPLCHTSFVETHCREIFEEIFKKSFLRKRHSWLKNDKTGYSLELDGYCSELNIAFEYQGQHHYKIVPGYKIGPSELLEIKRKDALKIKLCKENDVELIVVDLIEKPTRDKIYLIIQNLLKDKNLI